MVGHGGPRTRCRVRFRGGKAEDFPRDFAKTVGDAPLEVLTAVFDQCRLDARRGFAKCTAIGFTDCPDELIEWLVGQGLDVDTPDSYAPLPPVPYRR